MEQGCQGQNPMDRIHGIFPDLQDLIPSGAGHRLPDRLMTIGSGYTPP